MNMSVWFIIAASIVIVYYAITHGGQILNNHWSQYLGGLRLSTKEFYKKLSDELKHYEVQHLKIEEVTIKEGGLFSSSRIYLRLTWKEFQYDVCFAPFGNKDSFISWWLWRTPSELERIFSQIPLVGIWLNRIFYPVTYYSVDTANMFMTFAQSKVLKVLDEVMKEQNIMALPEHERYPMKQTIKAGK